MKILYFYQYFGTSKGGWSTRVYEMTRRWVAAGAQVTVVTSMYDKSDLVPEKFITYLDIEGINVKLIDIRLSNNHSFIKRLVSFVQFSITSVWYALSLKYDVVIASSGPLTIGIPGVLAKMIRGKKFVLEIRDIWPDGAIELGILKNRTIIRLARWFEKTCYSKADLVVAASIGMQNHVQKMFASKPITVIPNASDNRLMRELDLSFDLPPWCKNKKLVLYTGTLGLMDDCSIVVNLAKQLQQWNRNDIEVILIGDGKEKGILSKMAENLELNNIRFLGPTTKENVMRWLSNASISLLTFKNVKVLDTVSPNKMFDAFAAGVPMVQNTQGWIKDYFEKMNCGLTVPKSDPVAMAEAVIEIIDNNELWETMSKNAKKAAETDFDRDYLSAKMLDAIYKTVN